MTDLKVEKHPDKTFIGRAKNGVDFLGVHIKPGQTVRLARVSLHQMFEKVARLYEQGAEPDRVERYFTHWARWANGVDIDPHGTARIAQWVIAAAAVYAG